MWYGRGSNKLTHSVFRSEKPEGKKVKEVYDNEGLCHAWASGNVPRGRSHNMFFEDGIIYSFGRHYKAAKIYGDYVLINEDRYSPTTNKHLYTIKDAVSHKNIIQVPDVDPDGYHESNIQFLEQRIFDIMMGSLTLTGYNSGRDFSNALRNLNSYLKIFGLAGMVDELSSDIQLTLGDIDEAYKLKLEKTAKQREARDQREKEKESALRLQHQSEIDRLEREFPLKLQQWREGEISNYQLQNAYSICVKTPGPFGHTKRHYFEIPESEFAYLRVNGDKVETSKGADVPLSHALRLLDLIQTRRVRKGERVGHYTFDNLKTLDDNPPIVTIGCHKILLSEAVTVLSPYNEDGLKSDQPGRSDVDYEIDNVLQLREV